MANLYQWKQRPYAHQAMAVKSALKGLKKNGGFALLMEPRTGKTKTTVDIASIYHEAGKLTRLLVVCPINAIEVWVDEFRKNCPVEYRITIWDRHGRKYTDLPRRGRDILDVVIVNYDAFAVTGVARKSKGEVRSTGRYWMRDMMRRWEPQMMVLDESHRIKNPSAKKTSMICQVAWQERRPRGKPRYFEELVPYRLILTGTVLTSRKRIFDIYSQWMFLNPNSPLMKDSLGNRHTLKTFKEQYGVWYEVQTGPNQSFERWIRNKPGAEDKLRELMHAESFAVARSECFDLPERTEQVIHVPLDKSGPYYDEMAEEMIVQLTTGEITWAKIPLVQRLRLAQITSGVLRTEPTDSYPKGRLVRVGDEKLRYLQEILFDLKEQDEKVVIGARFRSDISAIRAMCEHRSMKLPCFEVHGGIDAKRRRGRPSERDQMVRGFREAKGAAVFIGQPAAAAEAIDLRCAGTVIWQSLVPSYVQFTQFEDRAALNEKGVRYIYLVAQGTVDEIQLASLREDGNIAARVTASPDALRRNFKTS